MSSSYGKINLVFFVSNINPVFLNIFNDFVSFILFLEYGIFTLFSNGLNSFSSYWNFISAINWLFSLKSKYIFTINSLGLYFSNSSSLIFLVTIAFFTLGITTEKKSDNSFLLNSICVK